MACIYVIQTLTSGSHGYPYDEIVEIGICSVDLEAMSYELVYSNTVGYDPKVLGKTKLDYLSEKHRFYAGDLYAGEPEKKVADEVMDLIYGKDLACYEAKHVFSRYMTCDPWDITGKAYILPSISARMPISLKCKDPSDEPDIIRKAYRRLLKNDPAGVRNGRRAADLAKMSACVMIHMREKGKY